MPNPTGNIEILRGQEWMRATEITPEVEQQINAAFVDYPDFQNGLAIRGPLLSVTRAILTTVPWSADRDNLINRVRESWNTCAALMARQLQHA